MSMKDNFYQAVKELLNKGGLVGSDLADKAKEKTDLDSYLNTTEDEKSFTPPYAPKSFHDDIPPAFPKNYTDPFAGFGQSPEQAQTAYRQPDQYSEYKRPESNVSSSYAKSAETQKKSSEQAEEQPNSTTSEITVISKNTVIDGNIRSFANIRVEGNVKGNVNSTKNAYISGKIIGNLICNNAAMQSSAVQGNITSKGEIILDSDSLVLGDLTAQYVNINGKVKGNIEVSGKAEFKEEAVILGNIRSATICILDGANIQGFVNTTFLQENAETVFPSQVSVGE